ncbi:PTS sugar transporter subunit IIC/EAL domain-containing protein [Agathobaculum sp.]|uniref:PTS sugar transporter subunit IIC/EAL domain-containing protein n=1 Tax=Agathobaculum sp. TaxID=2048138 RepID=UPI002A83B6D0|nr:EAL domain-containing protein [Agathobaculum sp.]MDY3618828.1 EAL domain-containing protein [Agathobaculum sp.]
MLQKIRKMLYAVENSPVLSAIKKGFLLIIPIVLTGSFALLLLNFPLLPYQEFLRSFGGGWVASLLQFIVDATTGFVSLYLVLAISYFYSAPLAGNHITLQIMAMVASCACFIASFGGESGSLSIASFGTIGVFTAMVCAVLATRLFFALELRLYSRYRSYAAGNDIHFRSSMSAIFPVAVCVAVFAAGNLLLQKLFHVGNLNDLISGLLFQAFGGLQHEPGNGVVFLFLLDFLWVFGIHGGNALDAVAQTVFADGTSGSIMTKSFLDSFSVLGGSGATLCLLLALLLVSRQKSNRQLAYSAAPLALFNINEILVFGFPIVLNPVFTIPFILTPIVSMLLAYGAAAIGWMPFVQQTVNWTTPVFFSGYLATGSWRGAAVQLVSVALGTLIYIPFVRLSERLQEDREVFLTKELTSHFQSREQRGERIYYLDRNDSLGVMAKSLMGKLRADIAADRIMMFYQPQVDERGALVGAEALLRWRYGGSILYPPLVVALAQEDGCFEALTWSIFNTVCKDIPVIRDRFGTEIRVSVNIVAEQLNDPILTERILRLAEQQGIHRNLVLEVTEETSLTALPHISANIDKLSRQGVYLAIDDFSMGHTSLNYLRNNRFHYVKLDGSLVRQVLENGRSGEIIGSIVTLGHSLGFQVVAEYVENQAVRNALLQLGCTVFQGYLYSPAVPLEELLQYSPT